MRGPGPSQGWQPKVGDLCAVRRPSRMCGCVVGMAGMLFLLQQASLLVAQGSTSVYNDTTLSRLPCGTRSATALHFLFPRRQRVHAWTPASLVGKGTRLLWRRKWLTRGRGVVDGGLPDGCHAAEVSGLYASTASKRCTYWMYCTKSAYNLADFPGFHLRDGWPLRWIPSLALTRHNNGRHSCGRC